jgi:mannose-P-dolichol utilization defect protein 1
MIDFANLPLAMPLAVLFWGGSDVSPEACLADLPFLGGACLSQLLAKALGLAIILGSCINKVPLVRNMKNSKSAAGISRNSLYGEALVYGCGVYYGLLQNYPVSSYGENISLLVQTFVLIVMTWNLSLTPVKLQEKTLVVATFLAFSVISLTVLPQDQWYFLQTATWPVMIFSRGSQLLQTYQTKDTGNLSIITTSMNLVGALIRVGTTLQETGDGVILAGYGLSFLLNFGMFVQYFLYLNNNNNDKKKQE